MEVVTDVVGGKCGRKMVCNVARENSIPPAEQDAGEETLATISMKRDDRLYVAHESFELCRV